MLKTELFFHDKESFQSFVKRQVRTKFYLPVSQRYTTLHHDRHSHIKVGKTQLLQWAASNWLTSDRMKVNFEPSIYADGTTFMFCYPVTKEYLDSQGITPDIEQNDLSETSNDLSG